MGYKRYCHACVQDGQNCTSTYRWINCASEICDLSVTELAPSAKISKLANLLVAGQRPD